MDTGTSGGYLAGPAPVPCMKCPASARGERPKFTDTQDGRRAHLRVFGHGPVADWPEDGEER